MRQKIKKVDIVREHEASLTHVSIRDAELGWRHITVEEASDLFPRQTVSASDRVFMCELCGQYVILTDGDIRIAVQLNP